MDPGDTLASAPPHGPRRGLRASLARLGTAAVGLLATRAELFGVELTEERERLTRRLAFVALGGVLVAFGALFAGAFVVAVFWETHRLAAIAAVAIVHAVAGGALLYKAKSMGTDAPSPFAASLDELRKDRALLERALAERGD
ncbi:MAG: hypothetical protein BroJett026_29290 [Betaproteobacteria bacterium]|nr:MAG: hypothetical protein BroJett026_29290 [Betaproteobacteria bacterium]